MARDQMWAGDASADASAAGRSVAPAVFRIAERIEAPPHVRHNPDHQSPLRMNFFPLFCGASLYASLALAADTTSPNPNPIAGGDAVPRLDTLTVTGLPLNASSVANAGAFGAKHAMEVPFVLQSYDAELIADTSARTLRDILVYDASVLNASYGGGFDNLRLRGFVMDNFNTIRREGLALAPHYDVPLELIERVDVLKGPSGFLYGFNSPGGTVNYIPKRPGRQAFTRIAAQVSSLRGRSVWIDQTAPISNGGSGYRVIAGYERIGDFDHLGDLERKFAGLAVDVPISQGTLLQLNADWVWKSAMSDPLLRADQSGRADPLDPATYVLPPVVDRRAALSPSWYRHETEGANLEMKLESRVSDEWTMISQANYSRVERHGGYAPAGSVSALRVLPSRRIQAAEQCPRRLYA
jgi:iron complex outermembrane recepter protein